jgi:microsomal epoxide hydrolase
VLAVLACLLPASPVSAASPVSRFVTAPDGVKIHCLEAGRGAAMQFVPGWLMPAEIWDNQIAYFADFNRVVAMDPRGQGRSDRAGEGLFPAGRARDIKAVIDQLGLAPVILVGWSMAVNDVASYVDQFGAEALAGVVLVDGGAGQDFDTVLMPRQLRAYVGWLDRDRREAADEFVRGLFKRPQSDEQYQRLIDAAARVGGNSGFTLGTASTLTDNRAALGKIDRPTLIVAAAGPLVDAFRDMQRRIRGSRLVVFDQVGHALFVEEPDGFNRVLDEFVRATGR